MTGRCSDPLRRGCITILRRTNEDGVCGACALEERRRLAALQPAGGARDRRETIREYLTGRRPHPSVVGLPHLLAGGADLRGARRRRVGVGAVLNLPRRRIHPIHMTRSQLAIAATSLCVLGSWAAATHAVGATADDLRAQLAKERRAHAVEVRTLRGQLRSHPDFQVSLQLAGIVYHQDWRSLERCALSEGARRAERYARYNARPNAAGSGATGAFQFMRGTFTSTPFAGLDWTRQDVQAFAAAWMWEQGRRREWAGAGC